jgi:hypothetical protein
LLWDGNNQDAAGSQHTLDLFERAPKISVMRERAASSARSLVATQCIENVDALMIDDIY